MFPLQQSGELCFEVDSKPNSHQHQQHRIPQDLMFLEHYDHDHPNLLVESKGVHYTERSRQRRKTSDGNKNIGVGIDEAERKKKHREIEKQRRQEIASLYASLRSLLPLEYVKGKRSISDHLNEAVKYIKHLDVKINELNHQREKLLKLSNSKASDSTSGDSTTACSSQNCVIEIGQVPDGNEVEIILSRNSREEDNLPLSTVLTFLLEQGLNVVSCISTKVKDRTLHKVHCEASEAQVIDLGELQQKLHAAMD